MASRMKRLLFVDDEPEPLHVHPGPRGPEVDGDMATLQLLKADGHGDSPERADGRAPAGGRSLLAWSRRSARRAR